MEVVGLISAKTESLGNDGACMQCDPANNVRMGSLILSTQIIEGWFSLSLSLLRHRPKTP